MLFLFYRYAITVWYYDADQREKAIKGYKGTSILIYKI